MITINVNGESTTLDEALTVQALLAQLGFDADKVAVAMNMEFVSRSEYANINVIDGADIEVLAAVQGG